MTIHQEDDINTIIGPTSPNTRRILFLSLEFNFSPFSGNGVLARSLVSSLVRRTDCVVRVICTKPHPSTPGISNDICMSSSSTSDGDDFEIWPVELPQHCQWKRLDRSGPWQEFTSACSGDDGRLDFVSHVREFQPTDVVAVDWHGMLAWESIRRALLQDDIMPGDETAWQPCSATICYYNFRVYSSSSWGHSSSQQSDEEAEQMSDDQFYREKEQLSCRLADVITCLSEHDKCMIQRLIEDDDSCSHHHELAERNIKHIHILHPPLRGDFWELASRTNETMECFNHHLPPEAKRAIEKASPTCCKQRLFLTCMVRLSPEKSPHLFVTLLQKLGGMDFLKRNSLIPIICGARSVEDYAQRVVDDFQSMCTSVEGEAWPYVIIDRHLGPKELAAVFSRTAVNVHPCLYDAYGMTLVESAAFGAPSIVNSGGRVGAVSLLGEGKGCIAVDLEKIMLEASDGSGNSEAPMIDSIQALLMPVDTSHEAESLGNYTTLRQIAKEARSQALGWDEMACCQGFIDILNELP